MSARFTFYHYLFFALMLWKIFNFLLDGVVPKGEVNALWICYIYIYFFLCFLVPY